jgi:hypothetical protein
VHRRVERAQRSLRLLLWLLLLWVGGGGGVVLFVMIGVALV